MCFRAFLLLKSTFPHFPAHSNFQIGLRKPFPFHLHLLTDALLTTDRFADDQQNPNKTMDEHL